MSAKAIESQSADLLMSCRCCSLVCSSSRRCFKVILDGELACCCFLAVAWLGELTCAASTSAFCDAGLACSILCSQAAKNAHATGQEGFEVLHMHQPERWLQDTEEDESQ